ncbi:GNAT family N-acetyltransferase [Oceanobacillus damuensis]|uniref:hypothetical protein n=1 Tax=Oceanobacillus damuensis TaxID=937928 RepID=UPI00082DB42B|nr:hypothetical protein [Oceanobacillus damuensis]
MKIMVAKEASYVQLEGFFRKNRNVDKQSVYHNGYVVEIKGEIEGCFILDQVENDNFWLKQLYITQSEAGRLPFLLEAILTLAKQRKAKSVYVHSHQPVVDILLEALQFHPQKEKMFEDKYPVTKGSWWAYNVS